MSVDPKLLLCSTLSLSGSVLEASYSDNTAGTDPAAKPCGLLAPLAQGGSSSAAAAADYLAVLRHRIADKLRCGTQDAVTEVLLAGVHCLNEFVQLNLCGPIQGQHVPLWQAEAAPQQQQANCLGQASLATDERWVASQLEADGEHLIGKVQGLDLLLTALGCLAEPVGQYTIAQASRQTAAAAVQGQADTSPVDSGSSGSSSRQQKQRLSWEWLHQQQLGSWYWWAMRAVMLQQQVLQGKSHTLQTSLKQLIQHTLAWSSTLFGGDGSAASSNVLQAAAHLEAATIYQHYGKVAEAQQQLQQASDTLGVEVELTGALGVRTKHQIDPKAQLLVTVKEKQPSSSAAGRVDCKGSNSAAADSVSAGNSQAATAAAAVAALDVGVDIAALGFDEVGLTKELEGMEDDSAVYLAPHITNQPAAGSSVTGNDYAAASTAGARQHSVFGSEQGAAAASSSSTLSSSSSTAGRLHPIAPALQALLLGWAAQIKKGTSHDDLQQWQMAPFVEAVLQQQSTQYMLHATARLLKCRHEKARGRTRERALMQLEQLCNALESRQPPMTVRLPYCHCVRFPLWPLLKKELAEFYIALGFVGAALKIFESLEMWDQLILCYQLLDKKQVALELVQQRLQVTPDNAKLWCVLGDIQQQDQHYEKAWQVSNRRSARAQRSIGKSALQRKEYSKAAAAYKLALGLNPLYPDVWFALGFCYLKLKDNSNALQAYTKVTQLEPENGEAWNNLAALWLQPSGYKEALHAAEQAIKHKRDNWQTWDNYATAAAKAGAMAACVRGLNKVLELTNGQHLSLDTLSSLLSQLEQENQFLTQPDDSAAAVAAAEAGSATADDEQSEETMDAPEQLLHLLNVTHKLSAEQQQQDNTAQKVSAIAAADTALAARQRTYDQVLSTAGTLLKSAISAPACTHEVWGLLGRWYSLKGELLSSQEAALKQVRALQSSPYKSNPTAFAVMAAASLRLCRAYLASSAAGRQGGLRELSAARMHLRGLLKQCEEAFGDKQLYKELHKLLGDVLQAEDAALAAKRAAAAE